MKITTGNEEKIGLIPEVHSEAHFLVFLSLRNQIKNLQNSAVLHYMKLLLGFYRVHRGCPEPCPEERLSLRARGSAQQS